MKINFKRHIALIFGLIIILAGCSNQQQVSSESPVMEDSAPSARLSQNLGTKWGENVNSNVVSVEATRLRNTPESVVEIYYTGSKVTGQNRTDLTLVPSVKMNIQDDSGRNMTIKQRSNGEYALSAKEGDRYQLSFRNRSNTTTYEVVATIDGLDVISGQAGSLSRSGYLLRPGSSLQIEGFRKSDSAVAAFRFSKPGESYAAKSLAGDVKNTGIIGVAIFEIAPEKLPDCKPQAFPQDSRYAPEPCEKR